MIVWHGPGHCTFDLSPRICLTLGLIAVKMTLKAKKVQNPGNKSTNLVCTSRFHKTGLYDIKTSLVLIEQDRGDFDILFITEGRPKTKRMPAGMATTKPQKLRHPKLQRCEPLSHSTQLYQSSER
jgi:hypothetical protein